MMITDDIQIKEYFRSERMGRKTIDVIIPCFNCHNTIKQTLSSIAMQDISDEIMVTLVDDCSDYGYEEIAELFSNLLDIQIIRYEENHGPGFCRCIGYDNTYGSFLTYMDADDTLISSNSLKILKNIMIDQNQDIVYGQFVEERENNSYLLHEQCHIWTFGRLLRRGFLKQFNIRMNSTRSNEDTGYNQLIKCLTDKIWYYPERVYTWRFKANSITRINDGMYGFESGYKGYLDNMVWLIHNLEKRFVNKNFILCKAIEVMCTLYFFHIENMQRYPMNTEASMNWIRGYYDLVYKNYENCADEITFNRIFCECLGNANLPSKGVVPKMTIKEFMDIVKEEPYEARVEDGIRGSTMAGWEPEDTPEDYPVIITLFPYQGNYYNIDSNTNRYIYENMKEYIEAEKHSNGDKLFQDVINNGDIKFDTDSNANKLLEELGEIKQHPSLTNRDDRISTLPYIINIPDNEMPEMIKHNSINTANTHTIVENMKNRKKK